MKQDLDITMQSCLATNPTLVLRVEDDDCALLFDPDNGRVQMMNRTAIDIWNLLDGKRSLQEVIACLRELYEGVDDEAEKQVLSTVETLSGFGAVGVWEQP